MQGGGSGGSGRLTDRLHEVVAIITTIIIITQTGSPRRYRS
jgi:hypothetical protein